MSSLLHAVHLRRILTALAVSAFLNATLIVFGAFVDYEQKPPSRIARILDALGAPSGAAADWLAPSDHDAAHFLGGAAIAIMSSLLFYTLLIWLLLPLAIWLRTRLETKAKKETGASSYT